MALYPVLSSAFAASYGQEGDKWILGFCMLRCSRVDVKVTQIGDVADDGEHMPLLACRNCIAELSRLLVTWTRVRDGLSEADAVYDLNVRLAAQRGVA